MNILIADDSRTARRMVRTLLEKENYTIVGEAVDGEEAYRLYKELQPDILTLDITMPVLDGIGALHKIKREFPEAKVIMVTAAGQRSKYVEAIRLGAADFITKPFDEEVLLNVVKTVANK